MASFRSMLGAFSALLVFGTARRYCQGFALPFFFLLSFCCAYLWAFVLRVPELKEPLERRSEEPPVAASRSEAAAAAPQAEGEPAEGSSAAEGAAAEAAEDGESVEDAPRVPSPEDERGGEEAAVTKEEKEAASPLDAKAPKGWDDDDDAWSDAEGDEGTGKKEEAEQENDMADLPKAQELKRQGNEHFKAGRVHDAREAYSEAIYLMPVGEKKERAILHGNRAACLQKLSRWEDVVAECRLAVDLDPDYAKAYLRRSVAYEAQSKWHDAFEDLKKAISLEPSIRDRERKRLPMLERRAQEQFEKDKDEMMGKLKDLGNTILGKFGMSVDNFKMEQDPETGSYSVKYNNPN